MKMQSSTVTILCLTVLLFSGCGEQVSDPPNAVPEINRLLQEGWAAYSTADYTTAIAKFDTVIDFDASETEAYIGKGWSALYIDDFPTGLGLFSFAISAEGKSPTIPVYDETSLVDSTWSETLWTNANGIDSLALIIPNFHPLMGTIDTIVTWNYVLINIDTSTTPPGTTYTVQNYITPVVRFTAQHFITTVPTDTNAVADSISITYSFAYIDTTTSVTEFQKDAYAGEAGIYKASNNENNAIIAANTVLYTDSTYVFAHDASVTAVKLHILLARSYYNAKLFYNAITEVLILDPTWTYDPFSPQFFYELAKKIEQLEG